MHVDEKMIDHLSNLARLEFSGAEKQAMIGDMEKIIGFVEKLNEVDTTGVEPVRYMGSEINVYREDVVGEMLSTSDALKSAALKDDQFFKVPKVIRK